MTEIVRVKVPNKILKGDPLYPFFGKFLEVVEKWGDGCVRACIDSKTKAWILLHEGEYE